MQVHCAFRTSLLYVALVFNINNIWFHCQYTCEIACASRLLQYIPRLEYSTPISYNVSASAMYYNKAEPAAMNNHIAMPEAIVYNTVLQSLSVCYEGLCGAMGRRPLLQRTTEHYSVSPLLQSAMGATERNKHPPVVLRAGELFPDVI